jgi:hypothetical protein
MSANLIVENNEQPIPLDVLCVEVPGDGSEHAHEKTLSRWCLAGVAGIKLESILCGRRRCSSRQTLGRFYAALTKAADGAASGPAALTGVPRTRKQKEADFRQSEAEYAAAGWS